MNLVDAHNDLLLELVLRAGEENPFGSRWLPKLEAGGVGLQVCPLYAATARRRRLAGGRLRRHASSRARSRRTAIASTRFAPPAISVARAWG